jgi:hypothetical protein
MDLIQEGEQFASANIAGRGVRSQGPSRGRGRARPPARGHSNAAGGSSSFARSYSNVPGGQDNNAGIWRQRGYSNRRSNPSSEPCQACYKKGHTTVNCWHRYDGNYVPKELHAAVVTSSYTIDTNWYTDSGATDNITSELEKLSIRDKYNGEDQIHTASGKGMKISHIGDSYVSTSSHNLYLKNILYVPEAKKNLVSLHRLTTDNSAFIEFHPDFFLIKDQATRRPLLRGPCRQRDCTLFLHHHQ